MIGFLIETLVWTGALIALVLLIRRTVARAFGAATAYALWSIPVGRLLLPPLVLPACFNPQAWMEQAPAESLPQAALPAATVIETVAVADQAVAVSWVDFVPLVLLAIWLGGAAIFLVRRFALYFQMRGELLRDARPVGEVGRVRLVETPEADGPVAFGVFDKVVALPIGTMADRNRIARDLAIAHELAHHQGHDLLVNFLVQPLFALHWFNPLGWAGWRALRRDQEAACDARVLAARGLQDRAVYADTIARYATFAGSTPRHHLAAPMACPVLGDKSIVHRLRSLSMPELSRRRRIAGRALLAAAGLALPLTASITYAAERQADAAQQADPATPQPAAPSAAPEAPHRIVMIQKRVEKSETAEGSDDDGKVTREFRIETDDASPPQVRVFRKMERDGADGAKGPAFLTGLGTRFDSEEMRAKLEAMIEEMEKSGRKWEALRMSTAADLERMPRIIMSCDGNAETPSETVDENGRRTIVLCRKAMMGNARAAIVNARRAVENDIGLSDQDRSEALRALDEALRNVAEG